MSAHTPGPWAAGVRLTRGTMPIYRNGDPRLQVAQVNGGAGEQEANAALIAAAPDLLAACRNLVADDLTAEQLHNRIMHARAAIARAEGR